MFKIKIIQVKRVCVGKWRCVTVSTRHIMIYVLLRNTAKTYDYVHHSSLYNENFESTLSNDLRHGTANSKTKILLDLHVFRPHLF